MNEEITFTVSEFIALFNQTMEAAYSGVVITGELANFRISKNRWVYFDLKDDDCTLKFFGTVYQLPGPLEDGMMIKVKGVPRLHNTYGFSVNIISLSLSGEGSIKRAASLLHAKLEKEGLFGKDRKRSLPYPPTRIGLITSKQSAAYADFIKVLNHRWNGLDIKFIDIQVQGEIAPSQIVEALENFNAIAEPPEVIVLIRGGGSPEDLAAFSNEQVTRAVAASRMPTVVAIGHEVDVSLSELAADMRASTPSNAAELLVPDKKQALNEVLYIKNQLKHSVLGVIKTAEVDLRSIIKELNYYLTQILDKSKESLNEKSKLIEAYNPTSILSRGYSIVRNKEGKVLKSSRNITPNDLLAVQLSQGQFEARVTKLKVY
jgi:exodeoxyribonuclease VII large subunit